MTCVRYLGSINSVDGRKRDGEKKERTRLQDQLDPGLGGRLSIATRNKLACLRMDMLEMSCRHALFSPTTSGAVFFMIASPLAVSGISETPV